MKRKFRFTSFAGIVAALALCVGCAWTDAPETDIVGNDFFIERGDLNFNFERSQEIVFIPVKTEIPEELWKIESSDESWCKLSKSYDNIKGLKLAVEESEETEIRTATMKVRGGNTEYTITVRQLGYGPAILVSDLSVPAAGGEVELEITSNIEYVVGAPMIDESDEAGWIERTRTAPTRAFAQSGYGFYAQANMLPFTRSAKIAIMAVDPMYFDASTECQISQGTKVVTIDPLPEGDMVKVASAYCSQYHSGVGADKLIDGDYSSTYHSPWAIGYDNPTTTFPLDWEFTFDGENRIDYFRLYSGTGNGRIGKFDVYYQLEGDSEYTRMGGDYVADELDPLFDFGKKGGTQTCTFPSGLVNVKKLMVRIYNGSGNNESGRNDMFDQSVAEGFVSAYEIEFYPDTSASCNDLILSVFTDLSCSELNSGVTRSDITELFAIAPYLAQYVAVPMMDGNYSNDFELQFRIDDYKAYSNIDNNNKLLTKKYSRMDNPTGIEVKAGDKLIVCVDKIPAGHSVSLAVYGDTGNYANYGGMSGSDNSDSVDQEVELHVGYNAINITRAGMCYIMNTAKVLSSASESIKVHIPAGCGTVQGYFDIERHTDADYMDMLSRTTYKYFIAKGRNMIFNFHTSKLREIASTGISSGLSAWDDIEGWQKELMGLDKLESFNNHIMAVSSSGDAYMDASNRRVNFGIDNALPKIISREKLLELEDNTWGPAHELGHVNQGAINWKSTTESSNNLFSNYAIYKMGKYKSRGQTIAYLAECYAKNQQWALMGTSTHMAEDTEVHMRMNWQLWNYFHRCGAQPDFFPTLFQMLREDPLPSEFATYFGMVENPGASQLKYAEKVCDAAQLDLTDFFEVWGFYRTIDVTYEQYGSSRYKIDEDMIAESKARIAAKGYDKGPAIQYIEDRQVEGGVTYSNMGYYTTFQNKTKITKTPRYSVSGRSYTVTDCEQAVAVEIRRTVGSGLGELLFFSNLSTFTAPETVPQSNVSLYAVQYDGERILINRQ
ncbi:MAG: M60 family metallopeptidase [Alistipes sp.]|nr:M60 family metallopeptidase [Alistipes sp.]